MEEIDVFMEAMGAIGKSRSQIIELEFDAIVNEGGKFSDSRLKENKVKENENE